MLRPLTYRAGKEAMSFYRNWFLPPLCHSSSLDLPSPFLAFLFVVSFFFLSFFLSIFPSLSLSFTFIFSLAYSQSSLFSFLPSEMKLWIDKVGCYKDKGVKAWKDPSIRAIKYLYLNLRKGRRINWQWGDFVDVIMECAQEAQARGYACFGIEFYGECWGSVEACDTYDRYGNSSKCVQGVGLHWALFVYKAKCGSGMLLLEISCERSLCTFMQK